MSALFDLGEPTKTPIISMWRPWANWVALGWKTIESRTHQRFASLVGHRIGIHASAKWDEDAIEFAAKYLTPEQIEETILWQRGISQAVICTVFSRSIRKLTEADESGALIECRTTRYGLFLEEPKPILPAIPMKGYQGIWRADLNQTPPCLGKN